MSKPVAVLTRIRLRQRRGDGQLNTTILYVNPNSGTAHMDIASWSNNSESLI
jgi:hypothetical protein